MRTYLCVCKNVDYYAYNANVLTLLTGYGCCQYTIMFYSTSEYKSIRCT